MTVPPKSYREVQYFHPIAYLMVSAAILVLGAFGVEWFAAGRTLLGGGAWLISAGIVFLFFTVLGRMVVEVDRGRLSIRFGWLGVVRRTIDIRRIEHARICLFRPLREYLGWGWRYGLDGSVCYTTRGRRGLELIVAGQRHIIGSLDPRCLKDALFGKPDKPRADRGELSSPAQLDIRRPLEKLPRRLRGRRRSPSNWGQLRPGDLRKPAGGGPIRESHSRPA